MKMATFCYKRRLFIRNYPILQQKIFAPDYKKKLQPQISVFIKKNSIFGSNRDPSHVPQLPEWVGEPDYRDPCFTNSTEIHNLDWINEWICSKSLSTTFSL